MDLLDEAESKLYEVTQGNIKKSSETAQELVIQAKKKIEEISKKVEALIVTRGGEGSIIYADHKTYKIEPIKVQSTIDPTGCGDAYRAGLLYGISKKWDWQSTGRLASVMGAIKIQNQGGQNHRPTRDDIEKLYTKKLIEENN